ncbi:MAG: hypothetical protein ABI614_11830 [Planctomycetota bacterium]
MSQNTTTQSAQDQRSVAAIARDEDITSVDACVEIFTQYAREKPEVVAMWAFGIGFILGWKLKPW